MAYAIEANQHSMVDRFGNFTHLVSGGNVQLPSEISRLDMRINLIDRPASGPLGAIQLSGGQGNFINDSDFEVSIDITNGESSLTIGQTNISKAYLLLNPYTGPGFSPNDGAIKCLEAGGIQSIQAYINGSWTPMTGTGGSVPGGANTEVQFNGLGNFAGDANFTWVTGSETLSVPNLLATASLLLEETGGGTDVITIQAPVSLTLPYTLTLPVDDGISGEFLQTDGSGVLTWAITAAQVAGADTQVQYNDNGSFGASERFTFSPTSDPKVLQLLGEPDYTPLTSSIVVTPTNNVLTGVNLMTQVASNKTKGIISMWPFGTPQDLQIYRFHGHDFKHYSSFDPIEDSILYTGDQNVNPTTQPPATMDLGMTSRLPYSGPGSSNGANQYGWVELQWEQIPGDDNPYIEDIYENTGGYANWNGQLLLKSGVPGIYIEERRWDRIIGRSNFTGQVSIRSTFAPNTNPSGGVTSGIDFYDLELARLENTTLQADWRGSSKMNFGLARLNVSRSTMVSPDLLTISTEKTLDLGGTGVNFDTFGLYGAASLYFKFYDGANGTGPLSSSYTALIDGVKGSIKCLGDVTVGSSSPGVTNIMRTTNSKISAIWEGPGGVALPVEVGDFGVGSLLGVGFGQLSLKGDNGVESLSMKGVNAVSGPSPYKSITMSTGLAYFENAFAVNTGPNSDNVGVMSLTSTHAAVTRVDILQLNSDFALSGYSPAITYGTNLINCKNSTSTVTDNSLFKVDVAGKVNQQTDQDIDGATFENTLTGLGGLFFTNSVLVAQSQYLSPLAPFDFTGGAQGGFSFMKCNVPNVSGGVWPTRCQIDGDGSIKNMVSLTVSDANSTWPPTGNSRNITLVPGPDSIITTRYSTVGTELSLQADGAIAAGLTYQNMVKIKPNSGQVGTDTLGFKLENNSSPDNSTENIMWWTRNSEPGSAESLYMVVRPAVTGATRPIFEFRGGGVLGGVSPNILRYYPEGLNSFGTGNPPIIIGDDRVGITAVIQMGGGKDGIAGTTVPVKGKVTAGVIDCDAIDTFSISGGTSASSLAIGVTLTDEVNIQLGGNANTGSGSIHLGTSGYIRCTAAGTPAGGSTGPTNICNANHNGYIGTSGFLPGDGSGLRGYSCIATTFAAAAKLYIARNQAPSADGAYTCCSSVESTQGVIIMRGRALLDGPSGANIDLDSGQVAPGVLVIPHTNPNLPLPTGTTFHMYQNFTVTVSNAGVLAPADVYPDDLAFDFTRVAGVIKTAGGGQMSLNIMSDPAGTVNPPVPDAIMYVDWVVYCERKDVGYTNSDFVSSFINNAGAVLNPPRGFGSYETWGTPAYTPGVSAAIGVDLDSIYGANNYIFA